MNKLTEWWINYKKLNDKELFDINQHCPHNNGVEDSLRWSCLENILREQTPMGETLNNHQLYVAENATYFIDCLFDKYLDDDTLLITTTAEHDSVRNAVKKHHREYLNHVCLQFLRDINTLNISPIIEELQNKQYKKVFVYIIGTQITTGSTTSQQFFIKLKDYITKQGLKLTMVIDDVHGLFLVPRDYNIFDYVISTAHALIRNWDMGLMWSKTDEQFGYKYYNWLNSYIPLLSTMQNLQVKLSYFSYVMKEEYIEYINKPYINIITDSVPHIFSMQVQCPPRFIYSKNTIDEYAQKEVKLECMNYYTDDNFYIRIRGAQFITFPEIVEESLTLIKKLLDRIVLFKEENE